LNPTLISLLERIRQKPPRSKLETHRELIRQLRRKGCTYRDIVRILHERVGLDGSENHGYNETQPPPCAIASTRGDGSFFNKEMLKRPQTNEPSFRKWRFSNW